MNSLRIYQDCEWNPKMKRAALAGEKHARATWILGTNGSWNLCNECEKLPKFKNFRARKKTEEAK